MSDREFIEAEFRASVLVRPASPYAFDHDDFSELVLDLVRESGLMADAVDIRLGYRYGDAGVPGWTWVTFILDEAGRAVVGSIVTAITHWGRKWIKKARERDPDAEPIKAIIYGPDGEVLTEVEVPPESE